MTELATREKTETGLAFNDSTQQLMRQQFCDGANDQEFDYFLRVCQRQKLDPFKGEIHYVPRNVKDRQTDQWVTKWTIQVGIAGQRSIASRTGEYMGGPPPLFYDGERWTEVWLDRHSAPIACKVGVMRRGFSEPCYAVCHWDEMVQTDRNGNATPMWRDKGLTMLAKCTEAAALRRAFPDELSGMYDPAEKFVDVEAHDPQPAAKPQRGASAADVAAQIEGVTKGAGEVKTLGAEAAEKLLHHIDDCGVPLLDLIAALDERDKESDWMHGEPEDWPQSKRKLINNTIKDLQEARATGE